LNPAARAWDVSGVSAPDADSWLSSPYREVSAAAVASSTLVDRARLPRAPELEDMLTVECLLVDVHVTWVVEAVMGRCLGSDTVGGWDGNLRLFKRRVWSGR
jgi:hypothetical protein